MKKFLIGIASAVVGFVLFAAPAFATGTNWDLTGTYVINFHCTSGCSGDYPHTLVVDTMNLGTGMFSGTGFYNPDNSITWKITGTVTDSNLIFHIAYDGSSYTVDGTGVIAPNGTLSGDATGPGQTFTWASTSGFATLTKVTLDWGTKLSPPNCDAIGKPIINVAEKVQNDFDSGQGGNNWAFDSLNRQIQVWSTGNHNYCALVQYEGRYNTRAGLSPGNTGTVTEGLKGSFQGGYKAIITGTLLTSSEWPTKGNVETVDYKCNIDSSCPGYIDWVGQYFTYTGFDQPWWGWIYHGGSHGTWINSSNGNFGDIIGN